LKGISVIIATLLLVIIAIAMGGAIMIYLGGIMPGKAIRVIGASCETGVAFHVDVRNLDTAVNISVGEIAAYVDGAPKTCTWDVGEIAPQTTETCTITSPIPEGGRGYLIKIVGPSNEDSTSVTCPP